MSALYFASQRPTRRRTHGPLMMSRHPACTKKLDALSLRRSQSSTLAVLGSRSRPKQREAQRQASDRPLPVNFVARDKQSLAASFTFSCHHI